MFCFAIGTAALQAQNNSIFPQQELRIDPEAATGGTASQLFDAINYIPLETTRQSLINKIDQLVVTKEHFFILDELASAVFVFKKNGKFLCRINQFGNLKKSAKSSFYINITYDYGTDELVIETYAFNKNGADCFLHYFKPDGTYIKSVQSYKNTNFHSQFACIGNHRFMFFMDIPYNAKEAALQSWRDSCTLFFLKSDTVLYKKYLPYGPDNHLRLAGGRVYVGPTQFTSANGNVLYYKRDNYTLYAVDTGGIKETFKFIFPMAYSFPPGFFTDTIKWKDEDVPKNRESRVDFLKKNDLMIYDLAHFYKMNDYLIFSIRNLKYDRANWGLVYNLKTGSLVSLYRAEPDTLNSFLPIDNEIVAADDTYIYSTISSNRFVSESEVVRREKKAVFKPELEDYFQHRPPNSNPVIIQLKLKQGL